ncbi:Hypothetical predicted protein [Olea europaea subsp. europaea]|uniref:Uncharacterized protein n=1 Tax=Olea europaea subsp. europaea TaxID=158383 RepID=A0A8S0PFN1_OLEEU|nr:Hypothetical predicted protein [Olea europaea subsp. europaea]
MVVLKVMVMVMVMVVVVLATVVLAEVLQLVLVVVLVMVPSGGGCFRWRGNILSGNGDGCGVDRAGEDAVVGDGGFSVGAVRCDRWCGASGN